MNWRFKGLLQKALSIAPAGDRIYARIQKRMGVLVDPIPEFEKKFAGWLSMVRQLNRAGFSWPGARCLELGTGWYPMLPVCNYLAGTWPNRTLDVTHLLRPDLLRPMADFLGDRLGDIAEVTGQPLNVVQERNRRFMSVIDHTDGLKELVRYRAPARLDDESPQLGRYDLVYTNKVLPHIPAKDLPQLWQQLSALTRPGGFHFHSINCGDQYGYFDADRDPIAFLSYPDWYWNLLWNSRFQYQNRLRTVDYFDMARAAGLQLVSHTADDEPSPRLNGRRIARRFRHYPTECLGISTFDMVATLAARTEQKHLH